MELGNCIVVAGKTEGNRREKRIFKTGVRDRFPYVEIHDLVSSRQNI
jgi:hypothetical protein